MALMKCHECGNEISSEAKSCPKCGVTPKTPTNSRKAIFGVIGAGLVVWYFVGGGLNKQVTDDFTKQYEIAKAGNDPIQTCVQAGLVAAGFLQGHDEAKYQEWKAIESADCTRAGVPK